MYDAALRPSEAASITYHDTSQISNTVIVKVTGQGSKKDDTYVKVKTKSPAGVRKIPLSEWGSNQFKKASDLIQKEEKKPIAINPRDLSDEAQKLLVECGVTKNELEITKIYIRNNPECDDLSVGSVTAYIFRRNRATTWLIGCGISEDDLDYLLGHKRNPIYKNRVDYNSASKLMEIAESLKVHELRLKAGNYNIIGIRNDMETHNLSRLPAHLITCDEEEMRIKLSISPSEPGESITIISNGSLERSVTGEESCEYRNNTNIFLPINEEAITNEN